MWAQTKLGATADGKWGPMTNAKYTAWLANCSTTTTTTPTTPTTPVFNPNGNPGDISSVTDLSQYSNEKIGEGENDVVIIGRKIKAQNGSDLNLTSLRVKFDGTANTGSKRFDRYADKVSVWFDGSKVGEMDADDFNRDTTGIYSSSITLNSGVVIKSGMEKDLMIAVTAQDNIDSSDLTSDAWTANIESLRFVDGAGVVLTSSNSTLIAAENIDFTSLAAANAVVLKLNLSSDNPRAKTVKVSNTANTQMVELLKFTVKAEGSDMYFDSIPVEFTTSATMLKEVTGNVTLKVGGDTFSETVTSTATTATVTFDELDMWIDEGDTETFTVYAEINDIENSLFDEGDTLMASISTSQVNAATVEDRNGNILNNVASGERSGSATGEVMTFRVDGVQVVAKSGWDITTTEDQNGNVTSASYKMKVGVTSFGNTLYVGQAVQAATTASAQNAFAYWLENSAAPTVAVIGGTKTATLSTGATIQGSAYRLDDGIEKDFTITVNLIDPVSAPASIRVQLGQIRTFTDSGLSAGGANQDLTPSQDFETDYKYITS